MTKAKADISITGPCVCGGSDKEPNYQKCERCRLIYFVKMVRLMRDAQNRYFKTKRQDILHEVWAAEKTVDELVTRFMRPRLPDDWKQAADKHGWSQVDDN